MFSLSKLSSFSNVIYLSIYFFLKKRVNERKIVRQAKDAAQKELVVSNLQLTVNNTPQKKTNYKKIIPSKMNK